jgi:DNA-binding MarR family transcriptional regulator
MLGYKSKAVMKSELASRTDGATPLSIWQIGRTVDSIAERHFFTRARKNRRQTFYSLTLRQDQLEAALMDDLQWSHGYHNRRRQRDEEFMARIQEAKSAIKVSGVL